VADGTGPTDAVNVRQLGSLTDKLDNVTDKAYAGIASVAALSAIPSVPAGKTFTLGMGYGYYSSESAVALGARGMIMDNISFTGGVGYSNGRLTPAVGVGFSW
jgi:autotransporter adhesin